VLDGLDEIAWAELSHAYGNASDVPGLLRQLAQLDPASAHAALPGLGGDSWHQGTAHQAIDD
jgi:hypothetical protein